MELPKIADYSVSVTYVPMIGPDGETIEEWRPAYWELRDSAMGEHLCDAIYDNGAWWSLIPVPGFPPVGPDARNDRSQMTREVLLASGLPRALVDELDRRVALSP
jgi:hypothetical protein